MLLLLLSGCGAEPESTEARIRNLVDQGEEAAEARELGTLRDMISDDYRDEAGRNKRALVRLLAGYFLRHKHIHLLTRIDSLNVGGDDSASLVLFVGMAGREIPDPEALVSLRADLFRFELELANKDDTWLLTTAAWRRAVPEDFF